MKTVNDSPVRGKNQVMESMYLQVITSVHHKSIVARLDVKPEAISEKLQASHSGFQEDGDGVGIGVLTNAHGQTGVRARRVMINRHKNSWIFTRFLNVVSLQPQRFADDPHQSVRQHLLFLDVLRECLPAISTHTGHQLATLLAHSSSCLPQTSNLITIRPLSPIHSLRPG